jgi:hypothetical protein
MMKAVSLRVWETAFIFSLVLNPIFALQEIFHNRLDDRYSCDARFMEPDGFRLGGVYPTTNHYH